MAAADVSVHFSADIAFLCGLVLGPEIHLCPEALQFAAVDNAHWESTLN